MRLRAQQHSVRNLTVQRQLAYASRDAEQLIYVMIQAMLR